MFWFEKMPPRTNSILSKNDENPYRRVPNTKRYITYGLSQDASSLKSICLKKVAIILQKQLDINSHLNSANKNVARREVIGKLDLPSTLRSELVSTLIQSTNSFMERNSIDDEWWSFFEEWIPVDIIYQFDMHHQRNQARNKNHFKLHSNNSK